MRILSRIGYLLVVLHFLFVSNILSQPSGIISSVQQSQDHRKAVTDFFKQQSRAQYIYQTSINPAATVLLWSADDPQGIQSIYLTRLSQTKTKIQILASHGTSHSVSEEPCWSPDGSEIAFLSDASKKGQLQVYIASGKTGALITSTPLTRFDGYVSHLKWSPDGKYISVLYVKQASREPSPMAAENKATGLIDSILNRDVQRIAVTERRTGKTWEITPAGLYIFEYDWSPDSQQMIYTAALPPGDDNWYIARLYLQNIKSFDTTMIYKPSRQIAIPRWSHDGKRIGFIEGLMSDQGGTAGELYSIAANGTDIRNMTPGRSSSPAWFAWQPDGNLIFSEFIGGSLAICSLNTADNSIKKLWQADESIRAGSEEASLSIATKEGAPVFSFIRSSWTSLGEIWCGGLEDLKQVTYLNESIKRPAITTENINWQNENYQVQGWLLYPKDFDPSKRYPMLVDVHGGPAWVTTPSWTGPDFNATVYAQFGYFVFFPNPRGSHGQGESFTLANRKDWGFGDLRDIIGGVDNIIRTKPVDSSRVGILGWSYGGSMAMMAGTQTNKFRAAVAGAGAGDWLSYYGQNAIDKWMWSYFDSSPYDDPSAYIKCSAMTYIRQNKTPTLLLVGERDGEAPPAQSIQYWHALKELHVPTQLKIYEGEGHSFEKQENIIDVTLRSLEWFEHFMKRAN